MRTTKWERSVIRCSAPKSKASVRASSWNDSRKLRSEFRHTIRKWTRSHRDGVNIVTQRINKTRKQVQGKRRSINYRSSHGTSMFLQHYNHSGCRSRRGAINYSGYGSRITPSVLETRFSTHPCGTTSLKYGCMCTTSTNSTPFRRKELEIRW